MIERGILRQGQVCLSCNCDHRYAPFLMCHGIRANWLRSKACPGRVRLVEVPIVSQEPLYLFGRIGLPVGPLCFFRAHVMPMDHPDVKARIRKICHLARMRTPDETGILPYVDMRKVIALPKSSRIAQAATNQPCLLASRINVL